MGTFTEWFGSSIFGSAIKTLSVLITIIGIILVAYRKHVTRENLKSIGGAFKDTVAGLSSPDVEVRISSAILLRRFLDTKSEYGVGNTPFAKVTVSVITAVLKTLQTSDLQKVLADSLRFAPLGCLQDGDFQRANLSKAFLGGKRVNMERADFFQANLSGTLLKGAVLNHAQFYESTLNETRLSKAQLRGASFTSAVLHQVDFKEADLRGASFDNARLRDVDFTGANLEGVSGINVVGYNVVNAPSCIQTLQPSSDPFHRVFVSRCGVLDARQKIFVDSVTDCVKRSGSEYVELRRDMYDASNVLSKLSNKIESCTAMIVFGFKSVHVREGIFRDSTEDSRVVKDEFLSTPWNHIEVGMAAMKGIPILLLVDDDICDGVFNNKINDELLVKMSISCCLEDRKENVLSWLKSVCVGVKPTCASACASVSHGS